MRGRPDGIVEPELGDALRTWGIDVASWTYEPVGFGDYHWTAADTRGRRWFVTVADLAHKSHCGAGADAAFAGLSRAMDTALALRGSARDGTSWSRPSPPWAAVRCTASARGTG
ncbi:hypothetical protein OH779_35560 [Actinacidiphila glaucinigra]|uniref:hypothetical protein n=1 Tax=Actinacidiphila glaucinigra TaxID=235986 RepID=UPI00386A6048